MMSEASPADRFRRLVLSVGTAVSAISALSAVVGAARTFSHMLVGGTLVDQVAQNLLTASMQRKHPWLLAAVQLLAAASNVAIAFTSNRMLNARQDYRRILIVTSAIAAVDRVAFAALTLSVIQEFDTPDG